MAGLDLQDADLLFAGDQDPDLQVEDAIAAAPAQTLHDKAKRLDTFLFFNLNLIKLNIVPFFLYWVGEGV